MNGYNYMVILNEIMFSDVLLKSCIIYEIKKKQAERTRLDSNVKRLDHWFAMKLD